MLVLLGATAIGALCGHPVVGLLVGLGLIFVHAWQIESS